MANGKIISVLNNRQEKNEGEISRLGLQGFLYSCGRLDPLLYLMILTRALTDEEFEEVKKQKTSNYLGKELLLAESRHSKITDMKKFKKTHTKQRNACLMEQHR